MPYSPNRTTQHGMTLVELLIAMALALFVGAAIITVFTNNSKSFREDENMQRMQDDARNAMRELAFDISMAGHYADLIAPSSITADTTLVVGTDCGPAGVPNWIYQMQAAGVDEHLSLLAIDNADGATVNANHSCIAAAELQPGTDVVSIKRVAGGDAAVPSAGSIYLRSNGTVGLLYREPASATPPVVVPAPFKDWQYRPRIYFVRNYSNTPGDGIPSLCRKVLAGAGPSTVTECLAQGIEDLQIEYGLDANGDTRPDAFRSNPTQTQMQSVVSVRIFLLARAVQADFSYDDVKTYALSNSLPYTPADNFHRRVSSITVNIPNIRALALLGI
jgi:type IV pilus assembly protein PilW